MRHTLIHKERYTLQGQDIWTALELYQSSGGCTATKAEDDAYLCSIGLSEAQREQLWRLHDQRHPLDAPRLMGIIYSNGFSNSDLGREPCLFVGATSRFNHSCRPNVGMDFAGYNIRLFTSRRVSQGEELCLSYNELVYYHSATVRKAVLRHKYKFDCSCSACATVKDPTITTTRRSDANRIRLGCIARQLATHIPGAHFLYDSVFEETISHIQAEELQNVPEEEGGNVFEQENGTPLERLMEYMALLHIEQIDHDLLQCSELAYDLSLASDGGIDNSHLQEEEEEETSFSAKYWARTTLALYKLHKGEHHTSTKSFLQKLDSSSVLYKKNVPG